jgi:hypothetical protein
MRFPAEGVRSACFDRVPEAFPAVGSRLAGENTARLSAPSRSPDGQLSASETATRRSRLRTRWRNCVGERACCPAQEGHVKGSASSTV